LKTKNYPIIAREGWLYIAISLILSAYLTTISYSISIPFWIISVFIIQFFRDPQRKISSAKNVVVSGADGRVIAIDETMDPYQKKKSIKVSVFMNVFNVHSNKAPIDGKILKKVYYAGKFLNAALSKASDENERCAIIIQSKNNPKKIITCVQIAGLVARRILCYKDKGDDLKMGERYGFIKFGSRVDLYLPLNTKVKVQLGEKVRNGESIIAEFI